MVCKANNTRNRVKLGEEMAAEQTCYAEKGRKLVGRRKATVGARVSHIQAKSTK